MSKFVVGLTGVAGAGKDVAADGLVERMGFAKLGFADPMYEIALDIDPSLAVCWNEIDGESVSYSTLKSILKHWNGDWARAKRVPSVREFLQKLGQAGREHIDPEVWVDVLQRRLKPDGRYVVTNVRHENEMQVADILIHIDRPGVGPVNNHPSESGVVFKHAHKMIVNDGPPEQLQDRICDYIAKVDALTELSASQAG